MKSREEIQVNNEVIGYLGDKLVVLNEWGNLYTTPFEGNPLDFIGLVFPIESLEELTESERDEVEKTLGTKE